MANASELLDQWLSAFVEGRHEDGTKLFNPDGVVEEIGTGRTTGVQEASANAQAWKAAFPDVTGTIENRIVAQNQAVGEIVWSGTNSGSLMGRPPTGKLAKVRAAVVLREQNGKIAHIRHYLDVAGMMAQLGGAPGSGG